MPGKIFIVGLAGPSGSGKSTVAKRVASRLNGHVISMEVYSIEVLEGHIRDYAAGKAIEAPIYNFAEHLRVTSQRQHVPAKSLLIVEGILALHFAKLRPYFDLSIYLEAPDDVCFHRRKVRDITERQRSLELIQWQYKNTVLPAAREYLLPSKVYADIVLDSNAAPATVEKNLYDVIVEKRGPSGSR